MNCEQARLQFADALTGAGDTVSAEFQEHTRTCASCREELDTLRTHWAALGLLEDAEPRASLRRGFYHSLEAYQQGLARKQPQVKEPLWLGWWPRQPVLQAALSLALLVAGVAIGLVTAVPTRKISPEVSHLRGEINSLRQLVTLSMLQQQSAVDRLQGVTWASRVEQSDTEVLVALLRTINQDPNVDVRLAAVDAMRLFSQSPVARRGLVQSLSKQRSPLMQMAVIDALVELRERAAAPQIEQLIRNPALDESVRKRALGALQKLE